MLPLFEHHENDEETLLHPILVARSESRKDIEDEVRTILRWHNRLDSQIDELQKRLHEVLDSGECTDEFRSFAERFRRQVELHLEHEETHFYPLVRELLSDDDLQSLAGRLEQMRKMRPALPVHPNDPEHHAIKLSDQVRDAYDPTQKRKG